MPNIFELDNMDEEGLHDKINIDELYEKKRLQDLNKLTMFKHSQCAGLTNVEWIEERVVNIPSSVVISWKKFF